MTFTGWPTKIKSYSTPLSGQLGSVETRYLPERVSLCYLINLSHRLKQILQYYARTLFLKNNENPLKVSELPGLSGLVKEIRFIFLSILLYIDRFRRFRSRINRHRGTCCFVFFLISFPICFSSLFSSFSCIFIPCSGYTL